MFDALPTIDDRHVAEIAARMHASQVVCLMVDRPDVVLLLMPDANAAVTVFAYLAHVPRHLVTHFADDTPTDVDVELDVRNFPPFVVRNAYRRQVQAWLGPLVHRVAWAWRTLDANGAA